MPTSHVTPDLSSNNTAGGLGIGAPSDFTCEHRKWSSVCRGQGLLVRQFPRLPLCWLLPARLLNGIWGNIKTQKGRKKSNFFTAHYQLSSDLMHVSNWTHQFDDDNVQLRWRALSDSSLQGWPYSLNEATYTEANYVSLHQPCSPLCLVICITFLLLRITLEKVKAVKSNRTCKGTT